MPQRFNDDPLIQALCNRQTVWWRNPHLAPFAQAAGDVGLTADDVAQAAARLARFAPYLAAVFPQTQATGGIIESPLYRLSAVPDDWSRRDAVLYLKADSELPVSGSIKARGGIYEVLQHAESLALQHGLLNGLDDDYRRLDSDAARAVFARHSIAVGSTGNLGLSIGIMAAKLGFQAQVHMSADAKQWKKDLLRRHGVTVYEYRGDYGQAVAQGRAQAEQDPLAYFIDDEHSRHLFLGYAVAGERVKAQLAAAGVVPSAGRPLYVYLACGVGGGPGGVAFGLKLAFGDHVHCVFVEPVASPCMLLGIYTGLHEDISVNDIGLDNRTAADGLAVARPSGFVGRAMQRSITALATTDDADLFRLLAWAWRQHRIKLEPSACAGFAAAKIAAAEQADAVHLVWATGGSMVPDSVFNEYLAAATD